LFFSSASGIDADHAYNFPVLCKARLPGLNQSWVLFPRLAPPRKLFFAYISFFLASRSPTRGRSAGGRAAPYSPPPMPDPPPFRHHVQPNELLIMPRASTPIRFALFCGSVSVFLLGSLPAFLPTAPPTLSDPPKFGFCGRPPPRCCRPSISLRPTL